jgi:hypothetical protein
MIEQKLKSLLKMEYKRFPKSRIEDYYKLVYQSVWGAEHNITDYNSVKKALVDELSIIEAIPEEPLYYHIGLDNHLLRLNLTRCKRDNVNIEYIASAFYKGAKTYKVKYGDVFEYLLKNMVDILMKEPFHLNCKKEFIIKMKELNYPPCHHSDVYKALYNPHYRIIPVDYLSNLIPHK